MPFAVFSLVLSSINIREEGEGKRIYIKNNQVYKEIDLENG
jgi:hypothetical protein